MVGRYSVYHIISMRPVTRYPIPNIIIILSHSHCTMDSVLRSIDQLAIQRCSKFANIWAMGFKQHVTKH